MIANVGSWVISANGAFVNLDNLTMIRTHQEMLAQHEPQRFSVRAYPPHQPEGPTAYITLFEAPTRPECDVYLAELFGVIQNREMTHLGRGRFGDRGPDGYPARFSSDSEPAKRNP